MPSVFSVSRQRVSTSAPSTSSNRQSATEVASGANTAKLVLSSSHVAPRGWWLPGHADFVTPTLCRTTWLGSAPTVTAT